MTKAKKTTKTPVLHAHKLKLPTDPQGFSGNLRRELARAVGRIGGDDERLASFIETLEVFKDFAVNKTQAQKDELQAKIADKAARLKTAELQALREAKGIIEGKRAAVAHFTAEIEAYEKAVGEK